MNPKAAIVLILICFAFLVTIALTWPTPQQQPRRYSNSGDYDAEQWLQEHQDVVNRARATVYATPTP